MTASRDNIVRVMKTLEIMITNYRAGEIHEVFRSQCDVAPSASQYLLALKSCALKTIDELHRARIFFQKA